VTAAICCALYGSRFSEYSYLHDDHFHTPRDVAAVLWQCVITLLSTRAKTVIAEHCKRCSAMQLFTFEQACFDMPLMTHHLLKQSRSAHCRLYAALFVCLHCSSGQYIDSSIGHMLYKAKCDGASLLPQEEAEVLVAAVSSCTAKSSILLLLA
jgi:methylase of polypeptide subunit release factors